MKYIIFFLAFMLIAATDRISQGTTSLGGYEITRVYPDWQCSAPDSVFHLWSSGLYEICDGATDSVTIAGNMIPLAYMIDAVRDSRRKSVTEPFIREHALPSVFDLFVNITNADGDGNLDLHIRSSVKGFPRIPSGNVKCASCSVLDSLLVPTVDTSYVYRIQTVIADTIFIEAQQNGSTTSTNAQKIELQGIF